MNTLSLIRDERHAFIQRDIEASGDLSFKPTMCFLIIAVAVESKSHIFLVT